MVAFFLDISARPATAIYTRCYLRASRGFTIIAMLSKASTSGTATCFALCTYSATIPCNTVQAINRSNTTSRIKDTTITRLHISVITAPRTNFRRTNGVIRASCVCWTRRYNSGNRIARIIFNTTISRFFITGVTRPRTNFRRAIRKILAGCVCRTRRNNSGSIMAVIRVTYFTLRLTISKRRFTSPTTSNRCTVSTVIIIGCFAFRFAIIPIFCTTIRG